MAAMESWTKRGDMRLARALDRAADRFYDAVMAARDAGLKVYLYMSENQEGEPDLTITVERRIPLPSDAVEVEGVVRDG